MGYRITNVAPTCSKLRLLTTDRGESIRLTQNLLLLKNAVRSILCDLHRIKTPIYPMSCLVDCKRKNEKDPSVRMKQTATMPSAKGFPQENTHKGDSQQDAPTPKEPAPMVSISSNVSL
jgi:hypothetical protein